MTTAYGVCKDCGAEVADREAMSAHFRATMDQANGRSHSVSIVNPTDEERRESRIRHEISDGLNNLYESLDRLVERVGFTAQEIGAAMWAFDLRDGWEQYLEDSDEDES